MKKIGIITGGGDCGGLNAVVKSAALMALKEGIQAYIIPNGYAGLYNLVDFDKLTELTPQRADEIPSNLAGSEAGHSRVKVKKIDDDKKYDRIKRGLKKFGIEGLIISGGDDTGSVMVDLSAQGIKCIHAPKTMDLDLQSYSVGFDSTVNRIATFAEDLKTTGKTHNRILIMEVFGRYAGHTAFRAGVAADVDAILIPEIPVDFEALYRHCKKTYMDRIAHSNTQSGMYLILVAEGLKDASGKELVDEAAGVDAFGHQRLAGAGKYVSNDLAKRFKNDPDTVKFFQKQKLYVKGIYDTPEIRALVPGHLVRCGHSSVYDVNFGKEVGGSAVILLKNGLSGVSVIGIKEGIIRYAPTEEVIKQRHVNMDDVAYFESLGVCFGREPHESKIKFEEHSGIIERCM